MAATIAQRLCHLLAGCEEATRASALRSVSKVFKQTKGKADEVSLLKICKALYYAIWMTDKPIKVRKVTVKVVEFYKSFVDRRNKMLYFTCLFRALSMEWASLDKNRLDKMLLFVRIAVAGLLEMLNQGQWNAKDLQEFENLICDQEGIFNKRSLGLAFQFLQTFMDEMKENMEELSSKNEFSTMDETAYLRLMKPFLLLLVTLENKQLLNTVSTHILKRVTSLPGIPHQGVTRAMMVLATSKHIRAATRKMLTQALKECGKVSPLDDDVEKEVETVVAHIESNMQVKTSKPSEPVEEPNGWHHGLDVDEPSDKSTKGKPTKKNTVVNDKDKVVAPKLIDISDELEKESNDVGDDMEEDDGEEYISLADVLGSGQSNARLGKHLREVATLNALRKYLIVTGQKQDKLMMKLSSPKIQRQLTLLSLHNIRKLNPIRKFKCARKLHQIMTITETVSNIPSKRRSIDISRAIHNIKYTKPGQSIVRKRNRATMEKKHVVFNLRNNQVATIPKKKRHTLTMPMWY